MATTVNTHFARTFLRNQAEVMPLQQDYETISSTPVTEANRMYLLRQKEMIEARFLTLTRRMFERRG